jgi:hypothetical protein
MCTSRNLKVRVDKILCPALKAETLKMEVTSSSETLVIIHQTRRHNPHDVIILFARVCVCVCVWCHFNF